jgi:hypothetical protein
VVSILRRGTPRLKVSTGLMVKVRYDGGGCYGSVVQNCERAIKDVWELEAFSLLKGRTLSINKGTNRQLSRALRPMD